MDIVMNQDLERLTNHGYIELHAMTPYFNKVLSFCVSAFPEARSIKNVGPDSNKQIIFLPKAKKQIVSQLRRELVKYEKAVNTTTAAIDLIV